MDFKAYELILDGDNLWGIMCVNTRTNKLEPIRINCIDVLIKNKQINVYKYENIYLLEDLQSIYILPCIQLSSLESERNKQEVNGKIYSGVELEEYISSLKYDKRLSYFKCLIEYLNKDNITQGKPLFIRGMKRTGKTILIEQGIKWLIDSGIDSSDILLIQYNTFSEYVDTEIEYLLNFIESSKAKYIFVDEVTQIKGLVEKGKYITDCLARVKEKLVLTGSDSITFVFAEYENLLNRIYKIDTSVVKYSDWCNILHNINRNSELTVEDKKQLVIEYIQDNSLCGGIYSSNESMYNYLADTIGFNCLNSINKNKLENLFGSSVEIISYQFFKICFDLIYYPDMKNLNSKLKISKVFTNIAKELHLDMSKIDIRNKVESLVFSELGFSQNSNTVSRKARIELEDILLEMNILVSSEKIGSEFTRPCNVYYLTLPSIYYRLLMSIGRAMQKVSGVDGKLSDLAINDILGLCFEALIFTQTYTFKTDDLVKFRKNDYEVDMLVDLYNGEFKAYEVKMKDKIKSDMFRGFISEEFKELAERNDLNEKGFIYMGETVKENGYEFINAHDYLMSL